ncbi:MAG: Serine/threonine-protein kinase PrkC [bacterium ADurb.Bin363]|nr:MAG: Serine/threonine-protein kinase PrkC [bacterium ADurb.Bin363]
MAHEILPETILHNHYKIIKCIYSAKFSNVYLAEDTEENKHVVIKELLNEAIDSKDREQALKKFCEEIEIYKKLKHDNMASVIDSFSSESAILSENKQFIVMEYIKGQTLRQIKEKYESSSSVKDQKKTTEEEEQQGNIAPDLVGQWISQISDALSYLSEQYPPVLFYYLSPDHIIITEDNQVKLINFGLGRFFRSGPLKSNQLMGIPGYASSEQYGIKPIDHKSDMFGIGAIAYYLLTKDNPETHPLNFKPVRTLNPLVSLQFGRFISRCLQMKPEERFENYTDFKEKLNSIAFSEVQLSDMIKKKEEVEKKKKIIQKQTVGTEITGVTQTLLWTINKYIPTNYLIIIGAVILIGLIYILSNSLSPADTTAPIAYLLEYGSNNIMVLDIKKGEIIKKIEISITSNGGLAISPDKKYLYATTITDKISVVDLTTCKEINNIIVQNGPVCIFSSYKGDKLFVINKSSGSVTAIENSSMLVIDTISVGEGPITGTILPNDQELYICNYSSNNVSAINLADKQLTTISVEKRPMGIIASPSGQKLYVTNSDAESISIIDVKEKTVTNTIPVPTGLTDILITSDGKTMYAANPENKTIVIIDTGRNEVVGEIQVKENISSITISPDEKYLYICNPSQSEKIPSKILIYNMTSKLKIREINIKNYQCRKLVCTPSTQKKDKIK